MIYLDSDYTSISVSHGLSSAPTCARDTAMGQPQKHIHTDLETWTRSDHYHNQRLICSPDPSLVHALETSQEACLPQICVTEALVAQLHFVPRCLFTICFLGKILAVAGKIHQSRKNPGDRHTWWVSHHLTRCICTFL